MAFQGYYIKFAGVQLPNKYVNNYKCTPDRRTDKNSGINSTGVLKRKILPHKRTGATFNTGIITDTDIPYLKSIFSGRDNITFECWDPSTLTYKTGTCYLPDIEFEVLLMENNINYYRPVNLELIEY